MRTPIGSKSGFLSYGPYERIPAGTYRFSISYSSGAATKKPVGFWDVVIFLQNEETVLSRGELMGTNDDKEIVTGSFELGEAYSMESIQIRNYVSTSNHVAIHSIIIKKLIKGTVSGPPVRCHCR